jgi:hypothetical protein
LVVAKNYSIAVFSYSIDGCALTDKFDMVEKVIPLTYSVKG